MATPQSHRRPVLVLIPPRTLRQIGVLAQQKLQGRDGSSASSPLPTVSQQQSPSTSQNTLAPDATPSPTETPPSAPPTSPPSRVYVSHSDVEKKRKQKITDCIQQLSAILCLQNQVGKLTRADILQLTLDKIEELKKRNADLEAQLSDPPRVGGAGGAGSGAENGCDVDGSSQVLYEKLQELIVEHIALKQQIRDWIVARVSDSEEAPVPEPDNGEDGSCDSDKGSCDAGPELGMESDVGKGGKDCGQGEEDTAGEASKASESPMPVTDITACNSVPRGSQARPAQDTPTQQEQATAHQPWPISSLLDSVATPIMATSATPTATIMSLAETCTSATPTTAMPVTAASATPHIVAPSTVCSDTSQQTPSVIQVQSSARHVAKDLQSTGPNPQSESSTSLSSSSQALPEAAVISTPPGTSNSSSSSSSGSDSGDRGVAARPVVSRPPIISLATGPHIATCPQPSSPPWALSSSQAPPPSQTTPSSQTPFQMAVASNRRASQAETRPSRPETSLPHSVEQLTSHQRPTSEFPSHPIVQPWVGPGRSHRHHHHHHHHHHTHHAHQYHTGRGEHEGVAQGGGALCGHWPHSHPSSSTTTLHPNTPYARTRPPQVQPHPLHESRHEHAHFLTHPFHPAPHQDGFSSGHGYNSPYQIPHSDTPYQLPATGYQPQATPWGQAQEQGRNYPSTAPQGRGGYHTSTPTLGSRGYQTFSNQQHREQPLPYIHDDHVISCDSIATPPYPMLPHQVPSHSSSVWRPYSESNRSTGFYLSDILAEPGPSEHPGLQLVPTRPATGSSFFMDRLLDDDMG